MKNKNLNILLFTIFITFYFIPYFISNMILGLMVLLIVNPLICFICSYFYGLKNSFQLAIPIFICLSFIPSVFIFYNSSALFYIFIYGILSLIGMYIGSRNQKDYHGGTCDRESKTD